MTHNKRIKGFTLVETLVSIAIIMIAITGPFAITENAIRATTISRDKSIATFLAQEGIEYVRAIRDKIYIQACFSGTATSCNQWWDTFTTTSGAGYDILRCTGGTACSLDVTKSQYSGTSISSAPFASGALVTCSGTTCGKLYRTATGEYTTSSTGNTPTIFSRKIVTTKLGTSAVKIETTVTWKEHSAIYMVTATDVLMPWE